jgi:hypothetical protein
MAIELLVMWVRWDILVSVILIYSCGTFDDQGSSVFVYLWIKLSRQRIEASTKKLSLIILFFQINFSVLIAVRGFL